MTVSLAVSLLVLECARGLSLGLGLGDPPQREHAVGQRGQGRDVVGEHRRHHAEAHRERAGDAEAVGSQDQLPAPLDVVVEVAGDVAQVAELARAPPP